MSTGGSALPITQTLNLGGQKDAKGLAYSPSGKYLAVCCGDGHVLLYSPSTGDTNPVQTLKPHESCVWSACFAPTEFGAVMATCSSDKRVVIQKEILGRGEWQTLYVDSGNESVVKSVEFTKAPGSPAGPMQTTAMNFVGLYLAAACLDGTVIVYSLQADHNWLKTSFVAHVGGTNVARWSPTPYSTILPQGAAPDPGVRLASGGVDGTVNIYKYDAQQQSYLLEEKLKGHRRAVVDLAWMPVNDVMEEKIASLSDDGTVIIWAKAAGKGPSASWTKQSVHQRIAPSACHLGWNYDGSTVACSLRDGQPPLMLIS